MTSHAPITAPMSFGDMFTAWLGTFRNTDTRPSKVTPAETSARRDFICEMLDQNTAAFASETDVQTMMLVYPCRF